MSGMTAPTPTPGTPANPTGGTPGGEIQPAPVATTPPGTTNPAGTPATGQPAPTTGPGPDPAKDPVTGDAAKTFTQAELDHHLKTRMDRFEKSWTDKFAAALGVGPEQNIDPAAALQAAQSERDTATSLARTAMAETLAMQAGVDPKRAPVLAAMIDKVKALEGVDTSNTEAVRAALTTAVQAKASEFPEWKATALPASSGGDRQSQPDGKRIYTTAELDGMNQDQLVAISDDLLAAAREGRIRG